MSYRKCRKSERNCGFVVKGVWGAIYTVNIIKRIARKLRRIILLHFGQVTFRFDYWKTLKPLMFMIWGFSDVPMTPKNQVFLFLETPGYF